MNPFKFKNKPLDRKIIDLHNNLPIYGFQFFFKNMKGYRFMFLMLTLVGIYSTLSGFAITGILSYIVTNVSTLTVDRILYTFVPLYVGLVLLDQFGGYYVRRYGEMLPSVYENHVKIRFFNTLLHYHSSKLTNYSKEKLITLMDKYVGYIAGFLNDWNWAMPRHIVKLIVIIIILWYQSPVILAINALYMTFFLLVSFKLSKKIAKPIRDYSEQSTQTVTQRKNFTLNINSIKKLFNNEFFLNFYENYISLSNEKMNKVRKVHSFRWMLQLNLFNLVFVFTFFYGIYQVVEKQMDLGFILLIQYAFNNLLGILIYFIEYYVLLINQREDNKILIKEIDSLNLGRSYYIPRNIPEKIDHITLTNVTVMNDIIIPYFDLQAGDKILIDGASGQGKSTLMNVLLNQIEFNGRYELTVISDSCPFHYYTGENKRKFLFDTQFSVVNSTDNLLNMSIWDNIRMGKKWEENRFQTIAKILQLDSFIEDFGKNIGDGSVNFSTGELQKLRIARAMYQDGDIYILDEPYSGIDKFASDTIHNRLMEYLKDKTIVLVSHDNKYLTGVDNFIRYEFIDHKLLLKPRVHK